MMTWKRQAGGDRGLAWVGKLDQRNGSLTLGLYLIGIGVFVWLNQQGYIDQHFWRNGWPWIFVLVGAIMLATARSASRVGDGVFFAMMGAWALIVRSEWLGLTWRNAWPLVLVAIGASVVAKAVAGVFLPEKQPKRVSTGGTTGKEDDRHV